MAALQVYQLVVGEIAVRSSKFELSFTPPRPLPSLHAHVLHARVHARQQEQGAAAAPFAPGAAPPPAAPPAAVAAPPPPPSTAEKRRVATLMDASHHRHPTSPEATPGRPRQHPRQWRFPNGLGSAAWHTMGGRSPHLVHSAKRQRTSTWWNAQQRRHAEPPAAKQQKGRKRLRWLKLCAPPPS